MAMNFALKFAIIEARTSQTIVSKKAGMHESRLSQIINGHRPANADERRRLARALRLSEEQIFPNEAIAS